VNLEGFSLASNCRGDLAVAFLGKRISGDAQSKLPSVDGLILESCIVFESLRAIMSTDAGAVAQNVQSRRYMSKSQRACDFCRERKSACRIEGGAPCQLCSYYNRGCTFNSDSSARKRRALNHADVSATVAPPMRPSSGDPVPALSAANPLETSPPRVLEAHNLRPAARPHHTATSPNANDLLLPSVSQSELQTIASPSGDLFDPFGDWFTSPDLLMNGNGNPGVSSQLVAQDGRYCGLTGDTDPYLLRLYRFNEHSVFPFKKLTVRSIDAGQLPVQFLQTIKDESEITSPIPDTDETSRSELDAIVPHVVGVRLISL
jgi:hypothetical protein